MSVERMAEVAKRTSPRNAVAAALQTAFSSVRQHGELEDGVADMLADVILIATARYTVQRMSHELERQR